MSEGVVEVLNSSDIVLVLLRPEVYKCAVVAQEEEYNVKTAAAASTVFDYEPS
jgi:hypothetical protein